MDISINEFGEEIEKINAAKKALDYIEENAVIGIGDGSTVNIFIKELALSKIPIKGVVAGSTKTKEFLKKNQIPIITFEEIIELPIYIDSTDAYNKLKQLIKYQSDSIAIQKILAYASSKIICIVDNSKQPEMFNKSPIAIEVIPTARSFVARSIVKLGALPVYRTGCITQNGNVILDIQGLPIHHPIELEQQLNNIPGIVENGILAQRPADLIIVGTSTGSYLV